MARINPGASPKRPGAGVYRGSGVAAGGQQGRPKPVHNGIGGARPGGHTPGASQRLPGYIGVRQPRPMPNSHGPVRGGKRPAPRPTGGGAARPGVAAPTAAQPVAAQPAMPTYNPQLHDSNYFMDLAGGQAEFDAALNPINADLARLRYKGVGGQTLYDTMYQNAQKQFGYQVRDTRDEMSKRGLARSGRFDREAANLSSGWTQQQRELDETVGSTAINRLETQAAQSRASFAQQRAAMEMAAAAREQERREAWNASLYGQTIMPEEG